MLKTGRKVEADGKILEIPAPGHRNERKMNEK